LALMLRTCCYWYY